MSKRFGAQRFCCLFHLKGSHPRRGKVGVPISRILPHILGTEQTSNFPRTGQSLNPSQQIEIQSAQSASITPCAGAIFT